MQTPLVSDGPGSASALRKYSLAVMAVAVALGSRLALDSILGIYSPYLPFVIAVYAAGRLGGRGPGLLATALSALSSWYLFIPPRYSFRIEDPTAAVGLGLFTLLGVVFSLLDTRPLYGPAAAKLPAEVRTHWSGVPFLRRAAPLAAAVLVIGILASVLWSDFEESRDTPGRVQHLYQVLDATDRLRSSVKDAEGAVWDYLLTGDDQYLKNYASAVEGAARFQATLDKLPDASPEQRSRMGDVDRLTRQRLDVLARTLEVRRLEGNSAAVGAVRDEGQRVMGQLRAALNTFETEEHRLIQGRIDAAEVHQERDRWILGLGAGTLVILLVLAGSVIERDLLERKRAAATLAQHARLIDLSQDAIISADGNRVITAWNAGATEVYGWTEREALGKSIHDLLRTHSSVSTAEINGVLANSDRWQGELVHTRSDGRQIVMDSRQTFIRGEDGAPIGVLEINRDITERKRNEAELMRIGLNLATAQHLTRAGSWDANLVTGALWWSDETYDIFGEPPGTVATVPDFYGFVHPDDLVRVKEAAAAVHPGTDYDVEHRIVRGDGEVRHVHQRAKVLANDVGVPVRMIGSIQDVTEAKEAREKLIEAHRQTTEILDSISDGFVRLDREWRYTFVNPAYAKLAGKTPEELVDRNLWEVWPGLEDSLFGKAYRRAVAENHPEWVDDFFPPLNAWFEVRCYPSPEGLTLFVSDTTERRQTEKDLRDSEEQFRTLASAIPQLSWMAHGDGWIFWYNQRWYEYTGTTPEQMEGWGWQSVHDPQALPKVLERWKASIATSTDFDMVFPIRGADGVFRPFLTRVVPIRDQDGQVIRWFGTNTDISEQRKIEEALQKESEHLRTALEAADLGAWEYRLDTNEVFWDERCRDLFGFAAGSRIGFGKAIEHIHPEDRPATEAAVAQAIAGADNGKYHREFRVVWPDGSIHWVASNGRVYFHDNKGAQSARRFIGVNMDITARKNADAALRESRAKLEAALASMTDAVFISDTEGRFIHLNDAFATYLRFKSKEQCSKNLTEYADLIEVFFADGTVAPREMWAVPRALRGEAATNAEYTLRRKDTGESWIGSYSFAPIRDPDGLIVGSVVVARDITDRKRVEAEIRQLNTDLEERVRERTAQLEASNRELEAFAYSVSHDLRAPLRGIDGWTLALQEDYCGTCERLDELGRGYLDRVRSETQRMGLLIDDLLQLSRITRVEIRRVAVDLSGVARHIAASLQETHPDRQFEFGISPGLTAFGDERLLEIVLTNLLSNAVKFTAPRAPARIDFELTEDHGKSAFRIRDNGVGFDMAYAGELFGAFQRMHKESEFPGSGIGLATVKRVIRRHGGRVWAEAEPDRGAAFYFTIGEEK